MIKEINNVRQQSNRPKRRWFTSEAFDIIVFYHENGDPTGFQFCYGKPHFERVLSYDESNGYYHGRIDDGESDNERMKATPIIVPDGAFNKDSALSSFKAASLKMDPEVAEYISLKIEAYK